MIIEPDQLTPMKNEKENGRFQWWVLYDSLSFMYQCGADPLNRHNVYFK